MFLHRRRSPAPETIARASLRAACALLVSFCLLAQVQAAPSDKMDQALQVGPSTGLPLPRYVSLKADRVNLRQGPSESHATILVFVRAGLPVEVTAEYDIWRKIRDADGDEGWVIQTLLSGRRTALVKPWEKGAILPIFDKPASNSGLDAHLQSGVIGAVRSCTGTWCEIYGRGFDGWIEQTDLWGVYPNEKID